MKALAVIGYHHTGKTTLATALIRELTARGYKVSSIKDIHSEEYRADKPGSNSAKHADAGAVRVFARGLFDNSLIIPGKMQLADILPLITSDFLIIEGMKDAPVPKLVCAKDTTQLDELLDDTAIGISGIIASELETYRGLAVYCLEKSLQSLVDEVIKKSFPILPCSDPDCCSACGKTCYQMACDIVQGRASRNDCVQDTAPELELLVNGEALTIVPFVQKLLKDSVLSFVHNLKGVDKDASIELRIKP